MEDQAENPETTVSSKKDGTLFKYVDSIVDEQISGFSIKVEELLREERVSSVHYSTPSTHKSPAQTPIVPFSEYVSHFNTPLPVHSYISSFRESISAFLDPRRNRPPHVSRPASTNLSASRFTGLDLHSSTAGTPGALPGSSPTTTEPQERNKHEGGVHRPTERDRASDESSLRLESDGSPAVEAAPDAISSVISQLQPDVFDNLVKIMRDMQKNVVHFYIHCEDDKSDVCWEIKVLH